MKKILSILIIFVLLFSGCSNKRDVELTDFTVQLATSQEIGENYFKIIVVNDIKDLTFTYEMAFYGDVESDINTIDVGDVKAGRYYFVAINSFPNDVFINSYKNLKVVSATGKVQN